MIIKKSIQYARVIDRQGDCGVFDTMNDAIKLACTACGEYSKYSLIRKNEILEAVTIELKAHLEELTSMICEELNINSYDDTLYRNNLAMNSLKIDKYLESKLAVNNKMANCEGSYIINGIITSCPNSIEEIIKNTMLILKTGNSVVFSSNENVKHVVAYAVKLINNAIEAVHGPKNLVVTVKEPSIENNIIMTEDERITMISEIDNHNAEKIAL